MISPFSGELFSSTQSFAIDWGNAWAKVYQSEMYLVADLLVLSARLYIQCEYLMNAIFAKAWATMSLWTKVPMSKWLHIPIGWTGTPPGRFS